MSKLISRQQSIPNGFIFYEPQIPNWRPPPFPSFDTLVNAVIALRKGNPHLTEKNGWSTDPVAVANEMDAFNAHVCEIMNWNSYITGGQGGAAAHNPFPSNLPQAAPRPPYAAAGNTRPPAIRQPIHRPEELPNMSQPVAQAVTNIKKLGAGAATILDWESEGLPHVDQATADRRAEICSRCPKIDHAKLLSDYFTEPLSKLLKKQVERMEELALKTPYDDRLKTCEGCLCPMRTKVWFPDALVLKRLKPEWQADLQQDNPRCWILALADGK